ncbi:ubiquitin carboxyl-terminal hydrolase 27 [Cucurbita pepo subsp. pepo]|uniref:ubiquitin carboxyl-terminal hydrolase 27 n=1 Tax=Cucurbita pepo subsp. pepo TaxID=3664 RepID=UPI000C9D9F0A|nr:ubiquitin carboxyl-terminal hydrolase 27 [Cucurbita pepo subsp. pepo]
MKRVKEASMKNFLRRLQPVGFYVFVAGLLSAAALFSVIRDGKLNNIGLLSWTAGASSSQNLRLVPGLQNLGNNCFFNVILQALASCVFFQPFLHKLMEEFELHEEMSDALPLTISLAALLEELSAISSERVVLSPRKVMLAMAYYAPNFNLTSQQDAAEAFLHLLSSLKEEISDYNHPPQCSLVDVLASNGRIITSRSKSPSELERWQGHFLVPFDGILGSILTCQSCSSQISLSFESFHNLPLSPVLRGDSTIVFGCTLMDCLKQFFAAEKVENYRCSSCWHDAGLKYLSSMGASKMEIEELMKCDGQDSCVCDRLFDLYKVPWSNKFSFTLKQLSIAHCPKILCIHLKRVSTNMFGDALKLQGHISFPLILDMSPFMLTGVEIKDIEKQLGKQHSSNKKPSHRLDFFRRQFDTTMLNYINGLTGEDDYPTNLASGEPFCSNQLKPSAEETSSSETRASSETWDSLDTRTSQIEPSETFLYRVVSVVQHFGRAGGGHYTVYRRVQDSDARLQDVSTEWFHVSDSEVHLVSEEEVLAAEATLLFYERI